MKKPILVIVLLLIIAAVGAEIAYMGWAYWWNKEVREEMRDKIVFRGKVLHRWTDDLKSKDAAVRQGAFDALLNVPPKDGQYILAALTESLNDEDNRTRCRAGSVMSHILSEVSIPGPMGPVVTPPLIEVLKDPDPNVRREGAQVLGSFGPMTVSALTALTELAKNDNDEEVRKAAASALEKIHPAAPAGSTKTKTEPGKADKKAPGDAARP